MKDSGITFVVRGLDRRQLVRRAARVRAFGLSERRDLAEDRRCRARRLRDWAERPVPP